MYKTPFTGWSRIVLSRLAFVLVALTFTAIGSQRLMAGGQAVATADARNWLGDWTLTINGGRGPQERTLTIKDAGGKVAATMAGGRGGPIEIADVSKSGSDLVLKFKQQGRGGEVDVVMTLSMQADGTLKVTQNGGNNSQTGTGKKKG
jgi:hypothetical protein